MMAYDTKSKDEVTEMFEARKYLDFELQSFHDKIQRFWGEPREVILGGGMSGTAQKFDKESLHVAYGCAVKVKHQLGYVYQYNERFKDFCNLWDQYQEYRKRKDWVDEKEGERLEAMSNEINF